MKVTKTNKGKLKIQFDNREEILQMWGFFNQSEETITKIANQGLDGYYPLLDEGCDFFDVWSVIDDLLKEGDNEQ